VGDGRLHVLDPATPESMEEPGRPAAASAAETESVPDGAESEQADLDVDGLGRAVIPAHVRGAEPEDLTAPLEAICFALNRSVTLGELSELLGRSRAAVSEAVELLATALRGRGLMLQRHRDELQLVTRPETAWAVQRALNPERPARLSRAALETLAIIAYRQPVTRASIEAIRGVASDAVVENLERRGLVSEVGRQDSPGHPRLYGTTLRFLQTVGLESIELLPPLPEGAGIPELADQSYPGLGSEVSGEDAKADPAGTAELGTGLQAGPTPPLVERPGVSPIDSDS
jgi:segregation and condensation protein B